MTRDELLNIFRSTNALMRGHFELSSGLHSGHYFQCAVFLQHPKLAAKVCRELASRFAQARPTVVVGPAIGGIVVAYEVARQLDVRAIFTERIDAEMALRRGFEVHKEDRAVVVEDVITTGESARKVIDLLEAQGVRVVGVGAIMDRSNGRATFSRRIAYETLMQIGFEAFQPSACPLCKEGIPAVRPGRQIIHHGAPSSHKAPRRATARARRGP